MAVYNIYNLIQVKWMIYRSTLVLLGWLGIAAASFANQQPTHEFTLKNGLKVIVREDHRAPVVVSQLWYKIGSSFETSGYTGLSHMLEHMMFKGSSKAGPNEASEILREIGAQENAFTTDDVTVYYQVLAKDRLPVALELEADRMTSLTLPADEFEKELEVVKEERRMRTDDNPNALAYERFRSLAYVSSGYRNPPIGWRHDLDRMKIEDLRQWHQRWYAPNNATLVVVGDVTVDEVKALVNRWFDKIPAKPIIPAKQPLEVGEVGERTLKIHVKTQLPSVLMAFNVPSLTTAENKRDAYTLELIAALLDGGNSARLTTELEINQELVSGAGIGYNSIAKGDSLFLFSALPNVQKGKTITDVEQGYWKLLEALKNNPPTPEELERVRAQLISSLVYAKDSITSQAMTIGYLESVGLSWRLADTELTELKAVTPEDIQRVAKKYFTRDRLTTAHVLPEEQANDK